MSYVICSLPNASLEIGGIRFEPHKDGVVSVDHVPADVLEQLLTIDGYKAVEDKTEKKGRKTDPAKQEPTDSPPVSQ